MKKFVFISIVSFFLISSCSTKKKGFTNRFYHNMTAKYNVLYNGNIALENGIKGLASQYKDDFREVLPLEPLQIDEEQAITIPGEGDNENKSKTPFEIAEEKAVKTVQKHGMSIYGKEYNKQIDEAYLLLGKARYYSQRFVPAIEAFDFLLKNFQNDNLSNDLRIWKAKTQIRLQNEDRAIKTLRNLLSYKDIKGETKENAHTALAMAYISIDSFHLAIKQLNFAVETSNDRHQHARNLFVLGQLLRQEGHIDSSQVAFKRISDNRKSPKKYKMHAYIEQAKNITDSTDFTALQEKYKKLIKIYENKNYLGELYYQLALMDFRNKQDSVALNKLTKSIQSPSIEPYQLSLSFEALGNYHFDKSNFVTAGAYYDSVLAAVTNDNTKRIRKLTRKRESLEELINYENLLKNNDSILHFVSMSESDRIKYFEKHIAKLKKADKITAIQKENAERSNSGTSGSLSSGGSSNNTGKWYFYSPQTVGFGKASFQRTWGDRPLEDNWRLSGDAAIAKSSENSSSENFVMSDVEKQKQEERYNIKHYLSTIPSDKKAISKMKEDNSDALYQLGLIYKEKFKEYNLATLRLERFLSEKPKEKFILPAKYHLYKIYEITGNSKLTTIKEEILSEYPESRFSKSIQNPDEKAKNDVKKDTETHYEKVYCDYEFEKYPSVLKQCDVAIKKYKDDPIEGKFELLKSYAIYKISGKKPFMENLEYVTVNYPKTKEAEHAQDMLDYLNGVKKRKKEKRKKISLKGVGKNEFGIGKPISKKSRGVGAERGNSPSRSERNPSNSKTKGLNNSTDSPRGKNDGSTVAPDSPSLK